MRPYMVGTPILEAKSSISLLRRKPRPSTVTPALKPPLRVVVVEAALPSASTIEKWVVWVDSLTAVACGGGGMKPAGRTSEAESVGLAGLMELRQAAAYFLLAICLRGRLLKSGSPR